MIYHFIRYGGNGNAIYISIAERAAGNTTQRATVFAFSPTGSVSSPEANIYSPKVRCQNSYVINFANI